MSETKMDEPKPSETKPKKMVRRSVGISLGIICILLIAVITYFSITGISAQNSYNNLKNQNQQLQAWLDGNKTLLNQTQTWLKGNITDLQNEMASLNSTYNNYVNDHHYTDEEYNSSISQNTNLQNQVNDLNDTLNLGKSTAWVDDQTISQLAGNSTSWSFPVSYAGYVVVDVLSSSTSNTSVELLYSWYGVSYANTVSVGSGGSAWFPVLPSNNIGIRVINTNSSTSASETVTITYYY